MSLEIDIIKFLENPFPLWEVQLTQVLAEHKWNDLKSKGIADEDSYTTTKIWLNNSHLKSEQKILITKNITKKIYLEAPSAYLKSFYQEHGIELLNSEEIKQKSVIIKIQNALCILKQIEPVYNCIATLVKAIHVLKNTDAQIDLSYSHPKIPFSIFVSVCDNESDISNLRVAESILHEAMHLKLTLIEDIVPLIKTNTTYAYYSPWKNEVRLTQGVLHGLFVFRAVYEFYLLMLDKYKNSDVADFINRRLNDIKAEFGKLSGFESNFGLFEKGRIVTMCLLQ